MNEKACTKCRETKPLSAFHVRRNRASGYESQCKTCQSVRMREAHVRRRYGLSAEEYQLLLDAQSNACAICGVKPNKSLCVDHDHVTGKVRGLLCNACNVLLGQAKDDGEVLASAIDYLLASRS